MSDVLNLELLAQALIAAGWTPPLEPPKPKVTRLRVEMDSHGVVHTFDPIVPVHPKAIATSIVKLTEGVFDEEW